MVVAEEVYNFIKEKGAVLPTTIAEHFNINTLFASAFLSELKSKNLIKISYLKVGSSPIYYIEEKKELLEQYINNFHEKEQKTLMLLKSKKVLEDIKLELIDRVSLRKMKDFAIPLNVKIGYENRLFWKYYLVSDKEAETIIKQILLGTRIEEDNIENKIKKENKTSRLEEKQQENILKEPLKKTIKEHLKKEYLKEKKEKKPIETEIKKPEKTKEKNKNIIEKETYKKQILEKTITENKKNIEEQQKKITEKNIIEKTIEKKPKSIKETLKPYTITIQEEDKNKKTLEEDIFGKQLLQYFEEKNIQILYSEIEKKNTEIYGVIIIPSVIGELEYFFYAKNKKTITEKDIKEAFVESTIIGYPLLFLAKGKISKNAYSFSKSKLKSCTIIEL